MKLTRDNLNEVLFENQDARLLIEDVVAHTEADLYYFHDIEITVKAALQIWNRAAGAGQKAAPYHVSFLGYSRVPCTGDLSEGGSDGAFLSLEN